MLCWLDTVHSLIHSEGCHCCCCCCSVCSWCCSCFCCCLVNWCVFDCKFVTNSSLECTAGKSSLSPPPRSLPLGACVCARCWHYSYVVWVAESNLNSTYSQICNKYELKKVYLYLQPHAVMCSAPDRKSGRATHIYTYIVYLYRHYIHMYMLPVISGI